MFGFPGMRGRGTNGRMRTASQILICLVMLASLPAQGQSFVRSYLDAARGHLQAGKLGLARASVDRALERDPKDLGAWQLLADVAAAAGDDDTFVHSLHRWVDVFDSRQSQDGQRQDGQSQGRPRDATRQRQAVVERLLTQRLSDPDG